MITSAAPSTSNYARDTIVDCAAPDMLALDAFFWRFYFGKLKG